MRLISADWVLPVETPPIRDGAILVDGDRIAAVGTRTELVGRLNSGDGAGGNREHFSGCVITPGLVNAHTHLTLTALAGVVPPLPFADWLPRLVAALQPWTIADHEASGVIGAEQCLLAGVTCVGDIAYGAAEVASASAAGLGGVYYWELLGIDSEQVPDELEYLRYPTEAGAYGPRVVCGLSPHAPYTAGPDLLRALHDAAHGFGVPVAIHVAESAAEAQLMRDGMGPIAGTAERQARGFSAPGSSTVAYLESLGVLSGATAVHACFLDPGDIALLAASARGVVTCPRSNRYLDNPPPAIAPLLGAGITVGIGTDSSASNCDLDLMAEVRALAVAEPGLPAETLLQIATIGGAAAIGVEDRFGSLAAGRSADLAVFAVAETDDPTATFVANGGSETVEAVMSGGVWHVRDGQLLHRDKAAAARAADAAHRAREAVAAG